MRLPVTSHSLRSKQASSSELVNCYVEALPSDAKAPYLIRRSPGTSSHLAATLPGGVHEMKFYPENNSVIFVTSDKSETNIASFDEGSGNTQSVSNGSDLPPAGNFDIDINANDIVVVAEPDAYRIVLNATGSLVGSQITDTDFTARGVGDVEFLDNYLLFREPNTGRFFGADLGSSSAFDALNFATAEGTPDRMVGMKSDNAQILLAGTNSMEFWDTTGGSGFPFTRTINGVINKGCINGKTMVLVDDRIMWLADDLTVRILDGLTPRQVSNPAIEQALQDDLSVRSEATNAFWYTYEGHNFYVLRTAHNCFIYDTATDLWHRRQSQGSPTWRFLCAENAWGQAFLGDSNELVGNSTVSTVAKLDSSVYTELGNEQIMSWTYQPVYGDGERIFHDRLEIIVETGVGTDSTEPMVHLEVSDDGGSTFSFMPDRSIGAIGERFQRVVWHNLGQSYQRVYRASVSAAVPVTVTDTILYAKGGRV